MAENVIFSRMKSERNEWPSPIPIIFCVSIEMNERPAVGEGREREREVIRDDGWRLFSYF